MQTEFRAWSIERIGPHHLKGVGRMRPIWLLVREQHPNRYCRSFLPGHWSWLNTLAPLPTIFLQISVFTQPRPEADDFIESTNQDQTEKCRSPLLQIYPSQSGRSLVCSSCQSDSDVHGNIESTGAIFCQADHQEAKRFERLCHVQVIDIQGPQTETVEESRDAGLGLCIVGCNERVEPSPLGKNGAEEGVERFHDMRADGKASGSFLRTGTAAGRHEAREIGGDWVSYVDDYLAAQRLPEIGHHRRRTAVWHSEDDDVALWCGTVRPGGRASAKPVGKHLRLGRVADEHLDCVSSLDGTARDCRSHASGTDDADRSWVASW